MAYINRLCITTGIYPPDTGGPAKFAESFLAWCDSNQVISDCVTLTNSQTHLLKVNNSEIYLISRNQRLFSRYWRTIVMISRQMRRGSSILANGLFLETLFASLITRKTYVCKVPGDIVWERARNSNKTDLDVDDFQNQRISWRYQIFRWLYSKSLTRARKVIVPSTHLYNLCVLWGVKQENLQLIYNSIDTVKFSPRKSVKKKFDVLVVNRLVPWKHVDEVISVCSQLGLSLAIIGDGPERPYLEKVALDSRAKVTFLGEVSQDELPSWIRSADCFVLNSSFEATSYSLLEARASGLFCIANGSTGSDEVINHEIDGLLCDKLSFTLIHALSRFKNDKTFVRKAGSLSMLDARNRFNQSTNFRIIKELLLQ